MIRLSSLLVFALLAGAAGGAGACAKAPPPARALPDPLTRVSAAELVRIGLALAGRGDDIRAEQYLSAALSRGAPAERALPALVRVCVRSSRYRTALVHVQRALAREEVPAGLRLVAATLYLAADQEERGQIELEQVVAQAPDLPLARFALGRLLADAGEPAAARRHLRAYLDLEDRGPRARQARRLLRDLRRARRDGGRP
ncbi:MAG TPA: hypothetical protein VKZ63_22595 [Kofleriaceae bacterium]|nr:hypothetical protein [Kofleriaceae bacterium]